MNIIANIIFGYLIAQAVVLIGYVLYAEWKTPSRSNRKNLGSAFAIDL